MSTKPPFLALLLLLLLPGLASALDLRRWDADVGMVRQEVLAKIALEMPATNDPSGPDRFFTALLEGLKTVQHQLDADTYLVMREAALTLGEEMGAVRDTLCQNDKQSCQERVRWELIETMFNLKLDFVRNVRAIMD